MPTVSASSASKSKSPKKRRTNTLTVTTRGQVTFRKEVLEHLGIRAGEKIDVEMLPKGSVQLRASKAAGTWEGFIGCLAGKTSKVATIEEINQAASDGWAGLVH